MTTKAEMEEFAATCVGLEFGSWTVTGPPEYDKYKVCCLPVSCECGYKTTVSKYSLEFGRSTRCLMCAGRKRNSKPHGSVQLCDVARIRAGADSRNLEYNLTPKYLDDLFTAQGGKCALSGVALHPGEVAGRKRPGKTRSLDRIDSSKGYIEGNVQWVHKDINVAKHVLSNEDFLSMCLNVVVHMTGWKPDV